MAEPEVKFPFISEALLKTLESTYPDRCPDQVESINAIMFKAGQANVVRFLRRKFEQQVAKTVASK